LLSLCGVSPIEASSGGGRCDIASTEVLTGTPSARSTHDLRSARMGSATSATRKYVARRIAEGKSEWEIMRRLERYIAREVYRILHSSTTTKPPPIETASRALEADIA
jgi:transposase